MICNMLILLLLVTSFTLSVAAKREGHDAVFEKAVLHLEEETGQLASDFCYVCLAHAYTIKSPSVAALDQISREVGINRYINYRDIQEKLVG